MGIGVIYMYGNRLKQLRKDKNLTIKQLSNKLELGISTYASYETESRNPTIDTLIKLANFHETTIDYIIGLSDNPIPESIQGNLNRFLNKGSVYWNDVELKDSDIQHLVKTLDYITND